MSATTSIRRRLLPVMALVIGALLAFCPALQAAEALKIGGVFAITGPASFLGDPAKKSMEMVVDAINSAGGIDGRLLEAVIYDTEGDPQRAVNAVSKLINRDGVIAIIGPSLTPTTLAVKNLAINAQVPLISCAAGIQITEPVTPWVFKTAQSDVLAVATVYGHIQRSGLKNVALLSVADAFGESGKQQLEQQAPAFGLEVVTAEKFGAKDADMTAQLTKIRKAAPDAVICWGTNPGPAVVAKNFGQLGLEMPLYQSHGVASPKFIELAGSAAEGILLPTGKILVAGLLPADDPQKPVLEAYIQQFESRFQMPVSGFGGYAYDAMQILAKALAGTDGDRDKVRANLEQITGHVGVSGVFNFSPSDHNGLGADAFVMVRLQDGKWELIQE
ncbi:MAG TPA: ABC transporter substrate-binding protein [Desulfobacterales bacterium]|nr:ABC transporter substrate-binding protein [Desulfobacterales bacterium]